MAELEAALSFLRKFMRGKSYGTGLRRIKHSFVKGILNPPRPEIWTAQTDGFCDRCADCGKYPRSTCFYDQVRGHRAAGPPCRTCGHVLRIETIVEEHKTSVCVLVECHGQQELHEFDLGSETWNENSLEPEDRYELLRHCRMQAEYFVPSEQGEKTVIGGGMIGPAMS